MNEAKKRAIDLKKIFGDRFYIEIQRHGNEETIRTSEEAATEEAPVVLTHAFISNSLEEEYSYPEAV